MPSTFPEPGQIVIVRQRPFVVSDIQTTQCDYVRTEHDETALSKLVDAFEIVIFDLSNTESIASEWLRWTARLSERARRTGKKLLLVGVKEQVLKTADVLGLKETLKVVKSLEEALAS